MGRHNNQRQNISPKMPNVLGIGDGLNHHDRTMPKLDQTVNQIRLLFAIGSREAIIKTHQA